MYGEAVAIYNKAIETPLLKQEKPEVYAMLLDNTAYSNLRMNQDKGVFDRWHG